MKIQTLVILISGLALVALFQNCSKQGLQINDLEKSSVLTNGTPAPSPSPSPIQTPPPGVIQLIRDCDDAKARGKIQSTIVQVDFEDNPGSCPWGLDDNMTKRNGYARARIEQVQQISLPAGAVVCNMKLEDVVQQNFIYDDNLILTLNGFLLASTTNFQTYFDHVNEYYKYDWSRLVDQRGHVDAADTTAPNQYCLGRDQGLSSCSFPQTETLGRVDLSFHERVIQNVLGMTSASDVKLTMITTGDDNASTDCHHSPIRFSVTIEYY